MGRISSITVELDLTLQPKAYQSIRLGLALTEEFDDKDFVDTNYGSVEKTNALRRMVSGLVREGIAEEVTRIYGAEVAEYCLNQKGGK